MYMDVMVKVCAGAQTHLLKRNIKIERKVISSIMKSQVLCQLFILKPELMFI